MFLGLAACVEVLGQELAAASPDLAEADALMKDGRFAGARECYERACAANPADAAAQAGQGEALLRLDRHNEATAVFEHALKLDPSCGRAKVGLARVLCESGKFSEGIDLLDAVLNAESKNPDSPLGVRALNVLGVCEHRMYKAQLAGEVTREQRGEWGRRIEALRECAEAVAGSIVVKLEEPLHTARTTEVETNAGGLAMVLEYLNIAADYDTLMGDSGMAFVWQATAAHGENGETYLAPDWPFAFVTRVKFLSQTLGRELRYSFLPYHAVDAESLQAFHREHVLPAIESEAKAGRPVLGLDTRAMVVRGYELAFNGDFDCFLVHWPGPDANRVSRFRENLLGVVSVGEPIPQLDRKEADRLAIQHAVLLGREAVFHGASFPKTGDATKSRTYYTGRDSFALWKDLLKNETSRTYVDRGYAYRNLATLRRSASAYLRAMATRHPEEVATALKRAAGLYERVIQELPAQADSEPEHPVEETPQQVADRISRIAEMEAKAIDSLEEAQGVIR